MIKKFFLYSAAIVILGACEEEEPSVPQMATLKIVNAIQDIGTIDLRGFEGSISFFGANTLRYGSEFRSSLPVNTPTSLMIASTSDTLTIVFSETINLDQAGGIYSMYLYGDSTEVQSFMIQDEFLNYQDSVFGARFINVSADSDPVFVRNIALDTAGIRDTTVLASDIVFQSVTDFSQFEVTNRIKNHTFEYLDADGNILASITVPQFSFFSPPYFRNITYGLIGRSEDGEGGNNLSIAVIEHFETF